MIRLAAPLLAALLAACSPDEGPPPLPEDPQRIVSLDHCADIHVLAFADREDIAALSPGASSDYTYLADKAEGIAKVRPSAEDVLLLQPDLIVRSYGGGPRAAQLFQRAGIPLLDLGWPMSLAEVSENTERLGKALGNPDEGKRLAAEIRAQLALSPPPTDDALYLTPSGITTGPGSMIDEILRTAGFANFEDRPGWHSLPLERLAYEQPGHIVTGFFDSADSFEGRWDASRHPIAASLADIPRTDLPGAWIGCSAFPIAEAVKRLKEARP